MHPASALLAVAVRATDAAAACAAAWRPTRPTVPAPPADAGISVLIPERGTPDLLARCLASTYAAIAVLPPAVDVDVVVALNGCDPDGYRALMAKYPEARWCCRREALGFGGAVAMGLQAVEGGWVYLLNSDMMLAPTTLSTLLPLRDRHTFAIASQIHFTDATRRREETGWTDFTVVGGVARHFDREPEGHAIRGHMYAGGGASLFQTALLRKFSANTSAYSPFYFEDADWGVQAACSGFQVKFCPASRVWHLHRGTIARYFAPEEIARIVRRNTLLFEARHGFGGRARLLEDECAATQRELTGWRSLRTALAQRWRTRRAVRSGYSPERACWSHYPCAFRAGWPTVIVALAGDAPCDVADLQARCEALAGRANVVLVSNHAALCVAGDARWQQHFAAVHLHPPSGNRVDAKPRKGGHDARAFARQVDWWRSGYGATVVTATTIVAKPARAPPPVATASAG